MNDEEMASSLMKQVIDLSIAMVVGSALMMVVGSSLIDMAPDDYDENESDL